MADATGLEVVVPPAIERLPSHFAKYVLKRRLARGGMAEVFLATMSGAEGFEKELVVKLIRPELSADEAFVRRFVEEAKTCVRLAHPNIVSIFELGVEHGVLYMVMELVRGATLAELLAEGGPLLPEEGAYVALEVARALDHAHRRSVIHRDVTPGNVMIDDEGAVKLLDFGIAAPAQGAGVTEVFGTPGHMPPEQMDGGRLSPATDLFALGTVLVEAWTGRAPFRRADARAARTAMTEGLSRLPSADHPELAPLDDLVTALVAPSPSARPQHADDVARRLRAHLRERGLDLDEIARGLRTRVARAVAAREARAEGRVTPPPPMTRTLRPTPLAEGTKTFATRGDPNAWSSAPETNAEATGGTRPVAEPSKAAIAEPVALETKRSETRALAAEGTRRIEDDAPRELTETPPRRSRAALWLGVAALAAAIGVVTLRLAPKPPPAATPSTSQSAPSPAPSPLATTSAEPSATTEPAASASQAAPMPSASSATALVRLVVASSPPARVELDGRSIGTTPLSTSAAVGEHRVVLHPHGLGERFERRVTLSAASGAEIRGDFNDEPTIVIRKIPATAPSK